MLYTLKIQSSLLLQKTSPLACQEDDNQQHVSLINNDQHLSLLIKPGYKSISAGVGLIPIAGDVALAVFKANSRNCKLVEEYLRLLGEEHISAGLPNLTPEPPPLPGGRQEEQVETSNSHPAQPAAKKLVKDHSESAIASGTANQSQNVEGSGTSANQSSQATQMQTKKKFWQK